jgi:hypothetical protein
MGGLQRTLIGKSSGNAVRLRPVRIEEFQDIISVTRCHFLRARASPCGGRWWCEGVWRVAGRGPAWRC